MDGTCKSENQPVYRIRVKSILDQEWADWFSGFTITPQVDGETVLTGVVVDQSALHGLIAKVGQLGLTLLSVERVETGQ